MARSIILLLVLIGTATSTQAAHSVESEGRIIGGNDVPIGLAPYMASLRSLRDVHFCGGTIVSNRYILTSAQCVNGRAVNSINVVVGTVSRTVPGASYVSIGIQKHPRFSHKTLANDLALVYTATVIVFNDNVQPAVLTANLFGDYLPVDISGWGIVSEAGDMPNNLQRITTRTIPNDDCRLIYGSQSWRVNDQKVCTALTPDKGTCYGDEGSAIVLDQELIGIASWHSHCSTGLPDMYERILPHRLWIRSIIA